MDHYSLLSVHDILRCSALIHILYYSIVTVPGWSLTVLVCLAILEPSQERQENTGKLYLVNISTPSDSVQINDYTLYR